MNSILRQIIFLIPFFIVLFSYVFLLIHMNRLLKSIKTLTYYDSLTTLPNSSVLEREIELLLHQESIYDFSLIMISVEHLSFFNQIYGYKTGDAILCEAAKRITEAIDKRFSVYRYKGDEFVVLINSPFSEEELDLQTQQILNALLDPYQIEDRLIEVSYHIGVFEQKERNESDDPLKSVTQAMNFAKYIGSNQIQKFNRETYNKLVRTGELQSEIVNGLSENQFMLVYQPLFYLYDGQIAEIEALIRWNHPTLGLLYPDRFIEIAERTGKIINIDYWVLEEACKQLNLWKINNIKPVILSVNLSSKTFETNNFIPDLTEMIKRYEIDPVLLQLELTERMMINNIEECITKLKKLRAMGIHIAIDDFGIGYSSLNYIVRLPIDSIKIDKSFVKKISSSKEAEAIVSAIINLCKKLKLNVIAEGVESRTELDYLKLSQCDIGQGYYFSKPVNINEIEASLLLR